MDRERHSRRLALCVAPAALFLAVQMSGAQQPTVEARLAFDVASVKVNASGGQRSSFQFGLPDGIAATNQTLRALISLAYDVPLFKLSGGPTWIASEGFDIAAKAERRLSVDEKRRMLRTLLEDRFALQIRRETHDARMYALVLNRDGRLGPGLRRRSDNLDCVAIIAARQRGDTSGTPPKPGEPPDCAAFGGPAQFRARGIALGSFVLTLSTMLKETIVDRTGLTGSFDVDLQANIDSGPGLPPSDDPNRPSIFDALPEQLGLKLEPQRGTVETFVIDRVERPTPD
jgi:uncharacterized protein (TIGR03435 family)